MTAALELLIFFAAGFLLRLRLTPSVRDRYALLLNRYVVYVALPALVMLYVPGIENKLSAMLLPVLSAWGIFGTSVLLLLLLARMLGWSRELLGALLFTVPLGNTSFLGVPFTRALFPPEALAYTLLYDQLGSFLILSTAGVGMLAYFGSRRLEPLRILRRMVTFPSFLALLLSLGMIGRSWPSFLEPPLHLLSASLSPVAMVAIGLQLQLRLQRGTRLPFALGLGIKLLLAPLILLLVFELLGLKGLEARVSVFESGMAPMVSSSTLAILAGLNPRFVASILGYGILLSFLTVPLLHLLILRTL